MKIQDVSRRRDLALWVLLLSSSLCLAIALPSAAEVDQATLEFYAFSNSRCEPCLERMAVLTSTYPGARFIVHELAEAENIRYFQRIDETLKEILSCQIVPDEPLIGVFEEGTLKAVTDGANSPEDWMWIVRKQHEGVLLCFKSSYVNQTFTDPAKIALLQELFKKTIPVADDSFETFFSLLVPVTLAALVDAINPCAFNSFAIFLTFVLFSVGRRGTLKIGLSFSAAVFLVYFSLGLGLIRFLVPFPQIKYFIAAFAGTLGVLRIVDSLGREVKFIPAALAEKLTDRLESALTPWGGFFAGALTAALVLPCSSAPYFIALDLLSRRATFVSGLLLLVFYNLIIILPFIALTVGVHAFSLSTMDIKLWAKEKRRWINLLIGIVLISLCLTTLL